MANPALLIRNNLTGGKTLTLDIKLDEDRAIRDNVPVGGTVNVGDVTTLDELLLNPQMRELLDANPAKATVLAGTVQAQEATVAVAYVDGGASAADDTLITAGLEYDALLLEATLWNATAASGGVATVRDAAAAGGNALTIGFNHALTTKQVDDGTTSTGALQTVTAGTPLYLHRTVDDGSVGYLVLRLLRLS